MAVAAEKNAPIKVIYDPKLLKLSQKSNLMIQTLPVDPKKTEIRESNLKESSSPKVVRTNGTKPTFKEQIQAQKAQATPPPSQSKPEEVITQ